MESLDELKRLHANEIAAKGWTTFLVEYLLDGSRASGSGWTTDGNSMIGAYFDYCAHRESGLSIEESYYRIGLIYGDDNVSDVAEEFYKQVAKDLGLSIKIKTIKEGGSIGYLGRVFINPWQTETSFQDLNRSLPKINITCAPASVVPMEVAAHAKVNGYLPNDTLTPILSIWCQLVAAMYENDIELTETMQMAVARDQPFCSRTGQVWPQYSEDSMDLLEAAAKSLGITVEEVLDFEEHLSNIADDFMQTGDRQLALDKMQALGPVNDRAGLITELTNELAVDAVVSGKTDDYFPYEGLPEDGTLAMLCVLYDAYNKELLTDANSVNRLQRFKFMVQPTQALLSETANVIQAWQKAEGPFYIVDQTYLLESSGAPKDGEPVVTKGVCMAPVLRKVGADEEPEWKAAKSIKCPLAQCGGGLLRYTPSGPFI